MHDWISDLIKGFDALGISYYYYYSRAVQSRGGIQELGFRSLSLAKRVWRELIWPAWGNTNWILLGAWEVGGASQGVHGWGWHCLVNSFIDGGMAAFLQSVRDPWLSAGDNRRAQVFVGWLWVMRFYLYRYSSSGLLDSVFRVNSDYGT